MGYNISDFDASVTSGYEGSMDAEALLTEAKQEIAAEYDKKAAALEAEFNRKLAEAKDAYDKEVSKLKAEQHAEIAKVEARCQFNVIECLQKLLYIAADEIGYRASQIDYSKQWDAEANARPTAEVANVYFALTSLVTALKNASLIHEDAPKVPEDFSKEYAYRETKNILIHGTTFVDF